MLWGEYRVIHHYMEMVRWPGGYKQSPFSVYHPSTELLPNPAELTSFDQAVTELFSFSKIAACCKEPGPRINWTRRDSWVAPLTTILMSEVNYIPSCLVAMLSPDLLEDVDVEIRQLIKIFSAADLMAQLHLIVFDVCNPTPPIR